MSQSISISFKRLPHGGDLPVPVYQTADAAGMDLYAAVVEDVVLTSGDRFPWHFHPDLKHRCGRAQASPPSMV